MRVVNEIFVPHHAVAKPPRCQAIFHRNLKIPFVFPFVALVAKCLFENLWIENFAKKIMSYDPLVVPRDDAASLLKQSCAAVPNVSLYHTVKHTVMELQKRNMKLRDDEILVLSWIANQCDALRIAR